MSYLETNNYLKSNQKYLFGELVQSTSKTIYQEQVFLFLEMLKVFFPGGDSLIAPTTLIEVESRNVIKETTKESNELSIRLLSRIFTMISFEQAGVNLENKKIEHLQNVNRFDFDIAQFCTLMERFKFTWRTCFQVILYRAFMQGRASIENCHNINSKLGFRKTDSGGMVGLLLKSILTRSTLAS